MPRSAARPDGAAIALGTSIALVVTMTLVGCAGVPTTTPSITAGSAAASPNRQAVTTASPTAPPGITADDYSTTCRPGPWPPDLPNVSGTAPADVAGAATALVPFAPATALLCLYIVDPDPHGIRTHRLVASRDVTNAALAEEISARLNSAAIASPGSLSCPKDSGTTLDIYFRAGAEQIEVEIGTSGCQVAFNGTYVARIGAAEPYLASVVPFPPGVE